MGKNLSLKNILSIIIGISIVFSAAGFIYAWTEPTSAPPDDNVAAPLNTSSIGQSKAGGLILNTGGATYGLIISSGNVGIGTTTPAQKLDVYGGYIKSSAGFCIGSSCITSWPSGGGGASGNWALSGSYLYATPTTLSVGIGTTTPTAALLEVGTNCCGFSGNDFYAGNSSNGVIIDSDASHSIIYGSDRLDIQSNYAGTNMTLEGGNVGIGTTAPLSTLQIESTKNALADVGAISNYDLILRSATDTNSLGTGIGFIRSSETNDIGAAIIFKRISSQTMGELQFYAKATSTDVTDPTLVMSLSGVGTTSAIHRLGAISFDWNGGYDSPQYHGIQSKNESGAWDDDLRVNSYSNIINTIDSNANDSNSYFIIQKESSTNGTDVFYVNESGAGYLLGSGWTYGSDIRMKENISNLNSGLDIIKLLSPVKFDYIEGEKNQVGFIAQDVQKILPDIVSESKDGMLGVKTDSIIPYLVKAVQEQQKEIDELKAACGK
jgi:hypothetical protein